MISRKMANTLHPWISVLLSAMLFGLPSVAHAAEIAGYKRESLIDYVKKRRENLMDYSASGMVSCDSAGGLAGNAQLVAHKGKRVKNVLVTAKHIFFTHSL